MQTSQTQVVTPTRLVLDEDVDEVNRTWRIRRVRCATRHIAFLIDPRRR